MLGDSSTRALSDSVSGRLRSTMISTERQPSWGAHENVVGRKRTAKATEGEYVFLLSKTNLSLGCGGTAGADLLWPASLQPKM